MEFPIGMLKIINIGIYPPPIGGVSIHVKRLHEHLLGKGYDTTLYDISGVFKCNIPALICIKPYKLLRLLLSKSNIFHFHINGYKYILLMYLFSFKHSVIYSWHNERYMKEINKLPKVGKKTVLKMLAHIDVIITDNMVVQEFAQNTMGLKNTVLIPEFIPGGLPTEGDLARLAPIRARFDYIIASNAFQIAFHENEDLYGIDMLVEMLKRVRIYINAGVIFSLPGIAHEDYFELLRKRIDSYGLKDSFIFIRDSLDEALSLWQVSDLVIRATNTDGNSLTIHEALWMETPVIASDCVERPDGVLLFKNRDVDDLVQVVLETLKKINYHKERVQLLKVDNNAEKFEILYKKLMEKIK